MKASIEEPFHLDFEQHLERYVDGKSNGIDREIVDNHIALCSDCADELRDLLAFKQQHLAAQAREASTAATSPRKTWIAKWQWLPLSNPAFSTTLVIAILIVGIMAAVLIRTTRRTRPARRAEHAANQSTSPSTGQNSGNQEKSVR